MCDRQPCLKRYEEAKHARTSRTRTHACTGAPAIVAQNILLTCGNDQPTKQSFVVVLRRCPHRSRPGPHTSKAHLRSPSKPNHIWQARTAETHVHTHASQTRKKHARTHARTHHRGALVIVPFLQCLLQECDSLFERSRGQEAGDKLPQHPPTSARTAQSIICLLYTSPSPRDRG